MSEWQRSLILNSKSRKKGAVIGQVFISTLGSTNDYTSFRQKKANKGQNDSYSLFYINVVLLLEGCITACLSFLFLMLIDN